MLLELSKYDHLLFSNINLFAELAEELKNLKEKVSGINVHINKLKKDINLSQQRNNELNHEINVLSKNFLKKFFNKEKLSRITKLLSEENEKRSELESKLISYEL